MLDWLLARDAVLRAFLTSYHRPWLDGVFWTLSALGTAGSVWLAMAAVMAAWRPRLRAAQHGRSCSPCSAPSSSWMGDQAARRAAQALHHRSHFIRRRLSPDNDVVCRSGHAALSMAAAS